MGSPIPLHTQNSKAEIMRFLEKSTNSKTFSAQNFSISSSSYPVNERHRQKKALLSFIMTSKPTATQQAIKNWLQTLRFPKKANCERARNVQVAKTCNYPTTNHHIRSSPLKQNYGIIENTYTRGTVVMEWAIALWPSQTEKSHTLPPHKQQTS